MPSVTVNGVALFYRQVGSGPHMVLVHGLAADHGYWYVRCAPKLASDFTVTMYDLRGHGLSDVPTSGYTTATMSDDLAALLDHLGIGDAHIVGHSFGGAVALQLAWRRPELVASMTIADTQAPGLVKPMRAGEWARWPMWRGRLADLGIDVDAEQPLDYRIIAQLLSGDGEDEKKPREVWQPPPRQQQRWRRLMATTQAPDELGSPADLEPSALERITAPVQLVYGELSFCLPAGRELERLVPHARMVVLKDVGHFFPVTKPALLIDAIQQFVRSLEAPR